MTGIPDYKLFYTYLDKAVLDTRTFNASGFPVPGFPYLRADRFLHALGQKAQTAEEKAYWVDLMRRYDVRMRTKEIQVLPERSLRQIHAFFGVKGREKICEYLHYYSGQYLAIDRQHPRFFSRVSRCVRIPRGYAGTRHVPAGILGYPFMAYAVRRQERSVAWKHEQPLSALRVRGKLTTYIPQFARDFSGVLPLDILRERSATNPLRVPELPRERLESLAWAFAPVITVDTRREEDRIGEISWSRRKLNVDTASPVLYYYATFTLIKEEPCLQINYAAWFPAAYRHWSPALTRVRFDGLILRVTLAPDGVPVMLDGLRSCGRSYFCAPRQSRMLPAKPRFFKKGPFVPTCLPERYPSAQLHVRIGAGSHLVEHVDAEAGIVPGTPYVLRPYKRLEMLPGDDGSVRSVFNNRGMLRGSREIRQRGRHVIKLSGRDPFTDPNLYERAFVMR